MIRELATGRYCENRLAKIVLVLGRRGKRVGHRQGKRWLRKVEEVRENRMKVWSDLSEKSTPLGAGR